MGSPNRVGSARVLVWTKFKLQKMKSSCIDVIEVLQDREHGLHRVGNRFEGHLEPCGHRLSILVGQAATG